MAMATSELVSVIIDDTFSQFFQFDSLDTWDSIVTPGSYMATSHVARGAVVNRGNVLNYVEILFTGVSLALVGNTAPPASAIAESFSVIIDGKTQPVNTIYGDPNPPSYRQWYQSPLLAYRSHNITLLNIMGASIDYAIINQPDNVILAGQTVIVDNDDPALTYLGHNWATSNSTFTGSAQAPGSFTPYGNTTQTTSGVGDYFSFTFPGGSDVTIYGVMDWTRLGNLSLSFVVDGVFEQRVDFPVQQNTSEVQAGFGQQANFPFYRVLQDLNSPGNHTIFVNVLECTNQTFTFDYITYVSPPLPAATQPAPSQSNGFGSKSSIGPIAGAAVGGLVFLVLVGLLFDCIMRRKRQVRMKFDYPFNHKLHPVNPIPLESITPPKGELKGGMDLEMDSR